MDNTVRLLGDRGGNACMHAIEVDPCLLASDDGVPVGLGTCTAGRVASFCRACDRY